jgi:AcrR family transcriptional regulator
MSVKPRTKPSAERREDLMNAAERLFLAQGVATTTIEQITAGAEVAKGSFYLHFASKERVVDALRDRFVDRILARVRTMVERQPETAWDERLAAWVAGFVGAYLDFSRLHAIVFSDMAPPTPDGLTDNPLVDDLAALLAAGGDAVGEDSEDPRFTAVFLFNALHGVVLDAMMKAPAIDRTALERRAVAHSFRVVGLAA